MLSLARVARLVAWILLPGASACHWVMPYEHAARDAAADASPPVLVESGPPDRAAEPPPPDLAPPADAPEPDAPLCTAAGVPSDCDPFTPASCPLADSWCYLVAGQGPSCVCRAGPLREPMACMTSVECQPGLVCRGDTPPGVCRPLCDPRQAGSCTLLRRCVAITEDPAIDGRRYGYCEPR